MASAEDSVSVNDCDYGWTIVSRSDQVRSGPVAVIPISCKRHYLRICAAGGVIFVTSEEAISAKRALISQSFGRNAYFKCRFNKHWLYKPTRREKKFFDERAIQRIMDV
jgi:hypothetical protein